jgi:FlaA1/EpsC-like NDP-sugar epimerase
VPRSRSEPGDRVTLTEGGPATASRLRVVARLLIVAGCVGLAWVAAFLVRFDAQIAPDRLRQLVVLLPWVIALQLVTLRLFGADRHSWRYTSIPDLAAIGVAVGATGLVLGAGRVAIPRFVSDAEPLADLLVPFGVVAAYTVLAMLALAGVRVVRRVQAEQMERNALTPGARTRRVLLIGAGRAGVMVANELHKRPDVGMVPVGFVDDDRFKQGRRIVGLDVLGTSEDLAELVVEHDVDEIVITIAAATGATIRELVEKSERVGKRPLIVPGVYEIVGGQVSLNRIRPVAAEDLLGREPVDLDEHALKELLAEKPVVVTGAGGSIGSELARQVARFGPKRLVLVERAEPALWAIHRELEAAHPHLDVVPAVADVTDPVRVGQLLAEHRPSTVLHAAAHKHVPMMEANPGEAIKNNLLGTRTVVDAAVEHDVSKFVLVSTDKAVNPTSVMGATKRLSERYVQHVAHVTGRDYVSVRFGNVLGSTGSVVPIFQEQIAEGGPVTVTHPEMKRYFMTIPEAAQLVLQAATIGHSGEILVLDMGEPVKIVDLAEAMIRLTGHEPGIDIPIEFSGLRPGEKLFEELSLTEEGAERTRHPKVWIGRNTTPDWHTAEQDIAELSRHADRLDPRVLRHLIASFVPEFEHGDTAELRASDFAERAT